MPIFISYRRGPSSAVAGRIDDHLRRCFGSEEIFLDVDSIPIGEDFRKAISNAVSRCDIFLSVVGADYLGERIGLETDFVRLEIESALAQGKRIIPILVDGVEFPKVSTLPDSVAPLAYLNAAKLDHGRRFEYDIMCLIAGIKRARAHSASRGNNRGITRHLRSLRTWASAGGLVLLAAVVGLLVREASTRRLDASSLRSTRPAEATHPSPGPSFAMSPADAGSRDSAASASPVGQERSKARRSVVTTHVQEVKGRSPNPPAARQQAQPTSPTAVELSQSETKKQAKELIELATRLYDLGKFGQAIEQFQAAYLLVEDPAILYNIGQAYRLGNWPEEAIDVYRHYLRRRPDAANREDVVAKIADLERLVEQRRQAVAR